MGTSEMPFNPVFLPTVQFQFQRLSGCPWLKPQRIPSQVNAIFSCVLRDEKAFTKTAQRVGSIQRARRIKGKQGIHQFNALHRIAARDKVRWNSLAIACALVWISIAPCSKDQNQQLSA
jgi:hypothetical protein